MGTHTNRHIRNTALLAAAGAIIWGLIFAALLIPTGIATAGTYPDTGNPEFDQAYREGRVCYIYVADEGMVGIVDRWSPYNGPYFWDMGTTSIGATLCEPWDYHYGSSGWQLEPWMPTHVEDRGETHTPTAGTSSARSDVWGNPYPWMSATLWFTPVAS